MAPASQLYLVSVLPQHSRPAKASTNLACRFSLGSLLQIEDLLASFRNITNANSSSLSRFSGIARAFVFCSES